MRTHNVYFFLHPFIICNHLPVMYVQVPQWADDWAVCAVDIPDANVIGMLLHLIIHLVKDLIGKQHLGLMQMV